MLVDSASSSIVSSNWNSIASTLSNSSSLITKIALTAIASAAVGFTSVLYSFSFAHAFCLTSTISGALTCAGILCGGVLVIGVVILIVKAKGMERKGEAEASSQPTHRSNPLGKRAIPVEERVSKLEAAASPSEEMMENFNNLNYRIIPNPNRYQLENVTVEDHTHGMITIEKRISEPSGFFINAKGEEGEKSVEICEDQEEKSLVLKKETSVKIMQVIGHLHTFVLKIVNTVVKESIQKVITNVLYVKTDKLRVAGRGRDHGPKAYLAYGGLPHENYASDPSIKLKALECASQVFEDEPASKSTRYEIGYNQFYVYIGTDRGEYTVSYHQSMLIYSRITSLYFSLLHIGGSICTIPRDRKRHYMTWITPSDVQEIIQIYENHLRPLLGEAKDVIINYLFCGTDRLQVYNKTSAERITSFQARNPPEYTSGFFIER